VQVTGLGALFGVHFSERPVDSYRAAVSADQALRKQVFFGLLNEGVLPAPAASQLMVDLRGSRSMA
jgi:glutamate-1-semialdehyde aminotransferase